MWRFNVLTFDEVHQTLFEKEDCKIRASLSWHCVFTHMNEISSKKNWLQYNYTND